MPKKVGENHDASLLERLHALAEPQCGLLTASQAVKSGIARSSLEYHARPSGSLERCARGLYRLRLFPQNEHSYLWRAYLPVASAGAAVSHTSALWLLGLYEHPSEPVHLTLPRSERWRSAPVGARLHFSSATPASGRVLVAHGLPTTAVEVAIAATIREHGISRELEDAAALALLDGRTSLSRLTAEWPSTLLAVLDRIVTATLGGAP